MHSASFLSQSFWLPGQASTSVVQCTPDQPDAHVHVYLAVPSVHVEPFWQGDDRQSLSSTSQL
jgi:hypothetical protein